MKKLTFKVHFSSSSKVPLPENLTSQPTETANASTLLLHLESTNMPIVLFLHSFHGCDVITL